MKDRTATAQRGRRMNARLERDMTPNRTARRGPRHVAARPKSDRLAIRNLARQLAVKAEGGAP